MGAYHLKYISSFSIIEADVFCLRCRRLGFNAEILSILTLLRQSRSQGSQPEQFHSHFSFTLTFLSLSLFFHSHFSLFFLFSLHKCKEITFDIIGNTFFQIFAKMYILWRSIWSADVLSGWTFCLDRLGRFVRTGLDVLSGPKYLDTI